MLRVFFAIVAVNVVLVAGVWIALERWPDSADEFSYTCATLEAGYDEVEVCIADDGVRYVSDCSELNGRGTVFYDSGPHQIVIDGHERYCLDDIREPRD